MRRGRPLLVIFTLWLTALALASPEHAYAQAGATGQEGTEESAPFPGTSIIEEKGERYVTMDFQDVEIAVLVQFISEITGKNFVLDERVKGKVTVIAPTRITAEEAYQALQAVLRVRGFTTVPSGAAIKIVPTKEAREGGVRTTTRAEPAVSGEEFITRLVGLRYAEAPSLAETLRPLVSQDGLLAAYEASNSLIIIDSAANVRRLVNVIEELDVKGYERRVEVIPLEFAYADELAPKLTAALEEKAQQAARPGAPSAKAFKIVADERTNSLIVTAGSQQLEEIRALIKDLDHPLPPGTGRINVVYLKYADAEDLLPVVQEIVGLQPSGPRPGQQPERRRGLAAMGRRPRPPGAQAQPGTYFTSDVGITADPATNSLIISATPQDFEILKQVIDKLDIRRRQVYVEAILLEISLDRAQQLGFEGQGGIALSEGVGLGRLNLRSLDAAVVNPVGLSGLILAAVSNRTVILPDGTEVPAQVALFTALQSDTDVNILSAPNIMTTDNEEAEIVVGQNVPFIASRSTSETNLSNVFATVQRQDVGITLRITPQISEGDVVRLNIHQEVSAIVPNAQLDPNLVGPTTTVRSADTTVTVKDGQTVVIGGMIADNISNSESKIPFLGDVPVIGHLFRINQESRNKINLLAFLTPHIIRDEHDAEAISLERRRAIKRAMKQAGTPGRKPDPLEQPSFELGGKNRQDGATKPRDDQAVEPRKP